MNETFLMKLALTCIIIGLPAFYVLSQLVPLETPPTMITGTVTAVNDTTLTVSQLVALPAPIEVARGELVSVHMHEDTLVKLKVH